MSDPLQLPLGKGESHAAPLRLSVAKGENATVRLSQRWEWGSRQAISFLMQQGVENPGVISLAAGLVDQETLPVDVVRQVTEEILSHSARGRLALQYGTTQGLETLRLELARHLEQLESDPLQLPLSKGESHTDPLQLPLGKGERKAVDPGRIMLTTGSQQLLSLICEILFDPGDICLVPAPTYFVFLGTLHGVGARVVPVPTDDDGMLVEEVDAALARFAAAGELERVKLVYCVSYYDNPSGRSLAAERRQALVDTVRKWSQTQRIFILEDAAYRELRYDGPVLPSIWSCDPTGEHVILAQTFSKTFSPGVRVGYSVVPTDLVGPIIDRKGNEDFGSANFNQHLLARAMQQGLHAAHVERVRAGYRAKRDAMLAAADAHFSSIPGVHWVHPHGGLYVWMTLPLHVETGFDSPLFRRMVKTDRVMYVPGELCHAGPPESRPRNEMRLSFGVQNVAGIAEGMERLSRSVRAVLG